MRKLALWISILILGVSVAVFAQVTDAPDEVEEFEVEEVTAEPVVEEREIAATEGVVYNDGTIDFASRDVNFIINASDEGAGVREIYYSTDGAEEMVYENPITFDTEGRHNIAFRIEDNVGNVSPVRDYSFIMDLTAPDAFIKSQTNTVVIDDITYVSPINNFVLFALDNLSGVRNIEYAVEGSDMVTYSEPFVISGETGTKTIAYRATDNVGNVSETLVYEFFLDATAPTVSISTEPEAFVRNDISFISDRYFINISAEDEESGVEKILYAIDDGEFEEYTLPFKLSEGSYVIKAMAVDAVGNISEEFTYSVEVDATKPEGDVVPVR
jgi:hypothetical protein